MTTTYRLNHGLIEVVEDDVPTGAFVATAALADLGVTALAEDVDALDVRVTAAESDIDSLETDVADHEGRITAIEGELEE